MAQQHNKMELYADIIGEDATPEDYSSIALHFESSKNPLLAGKFYYLAGKFEKAMGHLLKHATGKGGGRAVGDDEETLQLAVDVAARSGDEKLTGQLIDFLLGDIDGVPKDAKFLFRLYMAKRMFKQAAKTAVIIAGEEQSRGNCGPFSFSFVFPCINRYRCITGMAGKLVIHIIHFKANSHGNNRIMV